MSSLEDEFIKIETEIMEKLERYKELCERLGFNFTEHAEDLVDNTRINY